MEEIKSVFKKATSQTVLNLEPVVVGDSTTFRIITQQGEYFFRTHGKRINYDVEHAVLNLVRQKGVLAPKSITENIDLVAYPFAFSILEKIPGVSLENIDKASWPILLKAVGEQLSRVYSINLDAAGQINPEKFRADGLLVGMYDSWFEFLQQNFNKISDKIKSTIDADKKEDFASSKLTPDQIKKVLEITSRLDEVAGKLDKAESLLDVKCNLVHGDIHSEHILVEDGKLTGIIDFNKTLIADPLYDIAYFSVMPGGQLYQPLLDGTGVEFKQDRFNLYRLLISISKIHTRYIERDYLHKYPEILDFALEELNRK